MLSKNCFFSNQVNSIGHGVDGVDIYVDIYITDQRRFLSGKGACRMAGCLVYITSKFAITIVFLARQA